MIEIQKSETADRDAAIDELVADALDQCDREQPMTPLCDGCALHLAQKAYDLGFAAAEALARPLGHTEAT